MSLPQSELVCAVCARKLYITEECVLLEIAYVADRLYAVDDETGTYAYDPQFFHIECWEEQWDDFETEREDAPPAEVAGGVPVAQCKGCGGLVHAWQQAGALHVGEVRVSPHCPQGVPTTYFHDIGQVDVICMPCLTCFNAITLEMWALEDGEYEVVELDEAADKAMERDE